MSKDSSVNKKQHIDSALAAWAGTDSVPAMTSSTSLSSPVIQMSSGTLSKPKGKASSRMFKHLVRHTSVKDNKGGVIELDAGPADNEAPLFILKDAILSFLCQFILNTYPREVTLTHFNQSNTIIWRNCYASPDQSKPPSPVVIEMLSMLANQEDLSAQALESSLPPILNSASPADVCCSFWLYVTYTPEPIIPHEYYQLFITPAFVISHDVIVGTLRSLYRKLPPLQSQLLKTLALFSNSLLLDSEKSHRESLARVFSSAFSGRIAVENNPNRPYEDISTQWLFVDAQLIIDLEIEPWEKSRSKLLHSREFSNKNIAITSTSESHHDLSQYHQSSE